jgi:hypothetical protein
MRGAAMFAPWRGRRGVHPQIWKRIRGATKEEADRLYDQCLAEASRMIADPDYMDFGMAIPGFWKPLTG